MGLKRIDRESLAERRNRAMAPYRRSFMRIIGLDRSGPPPVEVLDDAPLRPFTLPNLVTLARFALVPVFLALGLAMPKPGLNAAAIVFACAALSDFVDGLVARATLQYSRFGALADPLVDRMLILAALIVTWYHDALPRWALAVMAAREIAVLILARIAMNRGFKLRINWPGRLSMSPLMVGLGLALLGFRTEATIVFLVGVGLSLVATALYVIAGKRAFERIPPRPRPRPRP